MVVILNIKVRLVLFLIIWLLVIIAFVHIFYHKNLAINPDQANLSPNQQQTLEILPSFHEQSQPSTTKTSTAIPVQQFKDVETRIHQEFTVDPDEKFLAYFTHSGFHNQRVALKNALLLAKLLNRTLLMPPVLFGPPLSWSRFDKMYKKLNIFVKTGLKHCMEIPNEIPLPAECLNYFSFTTVSWDFLFNMNPLRKWHKIIYRWESSYEWLRQNLHVNLDEDVHFIKDTTLFDYQIHDSSDNQPLSSVFKRKLDVEELAAVEKRVIHLGSLFGSARMAIEKPDNLRHAEFIKRYLVPHNPIILRTADRIIEQLGGVGNFIGLHIRVSDGFFMKTAHQNIDHMYRLIIESDTTNSTSKELDIIEEDAHDQDTLTDNTVTSKEQHSYDNEAGSEFHQQLTNHIECHGPLHPTNARINTVIFMATDARSPRKNPLLQKFFRTFPCVFLLDDFEKDLAELKAVRNVEDKTPLSRFLVGILDAVISAKGKEFYGTPKSTFSKYIKDTLRPVYFDEELNS
ncbi:10666_t:CDS:1 [Acaulospora colombiana]|uniref:10666_t:CDS:1 n=1 Tax=Acaulospora colombiana TaxID=27376 RepID=A0ACA9KYJ1_9GLOM|nr:10666_t:CDS:1 [Acaulospora colombiana]